MDLNYGSLGVGLALAGYIFFITGILFNKMELRASSWFLLAIINTINMAVRWLLGVNVDVLSMYVIGTWVVFLIVLFHDRAFDWNSNDTKITGLILICLLSWIIIGAEATVTVSAVCTALAVLLQYLTYRKFPDRKAVGVWLVFMFANTCIFMGAKDWSWNEICYPILNAPLGFVIVITNLKKLPTRTLNSDS